MLVKTCSNMLNLNRVLPHRQWLLEQLGSPRELDDLAKHRGDGQQAAGTVQVSGRATAKLATARVFVLAVDRLLRTFLLARPPVVLMVSALPSAPRPVPSLGGCE